MGSRGIVWGRTKNEVVWMQRNKNPNRNSSYLENLKNRLSPLCRCNGSYACVVIQFFEAKGVVRRQTVDRGHRDHEMPILVR
jgi:hypothetical protein